MKILTSCSTEMVEPAVVSDMVWQPTHNQQQLPETGLVNYGNTCYINVILQVVVHLDADFLGTHVLGVECLEPCPGCLLHTFLDSYRGGLPLNLAHLTREVSCFSNYLKKKEQDDCYFFWNAVVERLNPLSFQVMYDEKRKCMRCGEEPDPVSADDFSITLDIGPGKNLHDSLVTYFSWKEGPHCNTPGCDYLTRQKVDIVALPDVLSFRLKRLGINNWKDSCTYIFPSVLDMSVYTNLEGFYYTLYGVIVHVGRTGSGGHWLCYIKSGETWTCYNDAQVPEHCLEELVLIQQAYMMFYVKSKIPEAPVSRNHSGINVPEGIARDEVWPVVRNTSAQINEASSHVAPPNQQSPESLEHLVGLLDEVGAGFVSSQSSQPDTVLNIEERSETPPTR